MLRGRERNEENCGKEDYIIIISISQDKEGEGMGTCGDIYIYLPPPQIL